eukprot:SAG31_NODE_3209_length_4550_cov_4.465513_4_plen_277_part_00
MIENLEPLRAIRSVAKTIEDLQRTMSLLPVVSWTESGRVYPSAAHYAVSETFMGQRDDGDADGAEARKKKEAQRTAVLVALHGAGGLKMLLEEVRQNPRLFFSSGSIAEQGRRLLADPRLLDLDLKQKWLSIRLEAFVRNRDADSLQLVAHREDLLQGLCGPLGIHERTGAVAQGTVPRPLAVQFQGENGVGDGVRREWLALTAREMLDLGRGLFHSRDGGRTLQPNPHSALTCGADHCSYFALLGRIAGFSLYHKEPLDASFSTAFLKVCLFCTA